MVKNKKNIMPQPYNKQERHSKITRIILQLAQMNMDHLLTDKIKLWQSIIYRRI